MKSVVQRLFLRLGKVIIKLSLLGEIRVLHFDCKIDKMAKKAVSIIGLQYNKLYRSRAELPAVLWNQYYERSVSYNQELSVPCVEESVIYVSSTNCIRH